MSEQSKLSSFYCATSSRSSISRSSSSDIGTDTSTCSNSRSKESESSANFISSTLVSLPAEYPVVPLDPAEVTGHLRSLPREYKRQLIKLGPCQPRLSTYPSHERNGQKRSFQAKWFDLPCCKEWLE